jgi:hypothetical protein
MTGSNHNYIWRSAGFRGERGLGSRRVTEARGWVQTDSQIPVAFYTLATNWRKADSSTSLCFAQNGEGRAPIFE